MVHKNKNQIKVFLDGFLKLKNKKTFEINRNIEKIKMEKKKKISGAQWFVLSYKIKKIKFFLGKFLKFSFLKIFFPKKKSSECKPEFSDSIFLNIKNISCSKLPRYTGRVFFLFIKSGGFALAANLIENLLMLKNKIKIILVLERNIFHDISFFCRFKKLQKFGKIKKFIFFREILNFSTKRDCPLELKKVRKIIGDPKIGKMGFLLGFNEEKHAFLKILYRLGYSNISLKVF